MIARLVFAALGAVDAGVDQPRREVGREQQKIHAETGVAPERGVVHPEGVDALFGMQMPRRINPSLVKQPAKGGACLGLHHGIEAP